MLSYRLYQKILHPLVLMVLLLIVLVSHSACQSIEAEVIKKPAFLPDQIPDGLSESEALTLASLEQIDDFPLYTMYYQGSYFASDTSAVMSRFRDQPAWACSHFPRGSQCHRQYYRHHGTGTIYFCHHND